jgi:hypothetical protein
MNLRFSLLSLIGLTTLAGLASAALAKPSDEWLSVVVSLTVGAIFVQTFRALLFEGPSRVAAVGWLLFVTAYLALTIGPWLHTHVGPQLVTSQALGYAQIHWRREPTPTDVDYMTRTSVWLDLTNQLMAANAMGNTVALNDGTSSTLLAAGSTPPAISQFQLSGHWLFAWLAGWLGAALATHFQARSRNGPLRPETGTGAVAT